MNTGTSLVYPFIRAWHGLSKKMRIIAVILFFVCLISAMVTLGRIIILGSFNEAVHGGTVTEGIIGIPRYINPILASTQADLDATALAYAGLMRKTAFDTYAPNIASACEMDEAKKQYTCTINEKARFHDGEKVTAHDVAFTIDRIQKGYGTQALELAWRGVRVEAPDTSTVIFNLDQQFSGFSDMLTIGILPKHIWSSYSKDTFASAEYNINPIGAGAYKLSRVVYERKNGKRFPSEFYFTAFRRAIHKPYLEHIVLVPFASEDEVVRALNKGSISATAYLSDAAAQGFVDSNRFKVIDRPITKPFMLFLNDDVVPALRSADVRTVFYNILSNMQVKNANRFGFAIQSPTAIGQSKDTLPTISPISDDQIATSLSKAGYAWSEELTAYVDKKTSKPLSIPLVTAQSKELQALAATIQTAFAQYGIEITPQYVDTATLEQQYIHNRSFGLLLFGQEINRSADWFAYLHSSQIEYPGLNITRTADTSVDKYVEGLISESDPQKRTELVSLLEKRFVDQKLPVFFLYEPVFHYVTKSKFTIKIASTVQSAADRFNTVSEWYRYNVHTWKIFAKNK